MAGKFTNVGGSANDSGKVFAVLGGGVAVRSMDSDAGSPRPHPWSGTLVVGILAVLTVRYLLWRLLATLNLSPPLKGVFSLGLFFLELLLLVGGMIQFILLLWVRDRRSEADRVFLKVVNDEFTPTVDISS